MCLSNIYEETINDNEFVVYKVVRVINNNYFSPFFLNPLSLNNIYESELIPRFDSVLGKVVINKAIHTFINLSDALLFKKHLEKQGKEYSILKCVIPLQARYYSGVFNYYVFSFNCIASNKIIYLNEL